MTTGRALLVWLLMIPLAFANGTLRQFGYGPRLGEPAAHQLSCVTAVFAFGILVVVTSRRWPFTNYSQALSVGGLWAVLTVAFETALGRMRGMPWRDVLADYALWDGHLWGIVVLFLAMAPSLILAFERSRTRHVMQQ
jgi:hypothetical protein